MLTEKNILIVEDDLILAENIKQSLQKDGFHIVGIANTLKTAVAIMGKHEVNLALIDIQLKGNDNGVLVASEIRAIKRIPIIYITGNTPLELHEAMEKTCPAAFLEKPLRMRELSVQIDLALKNFSNGIFSEVEVKQEDSIYIKEVNKSFYVKIQTKEISFVEADKMKSKIFLTKSEYARIYPNLPNQYISVAVPMIRLTDKLPSNFISFHKSYLVNPDFIDKIDPTCIFVQSHKIPIPDGKSKSVLSKFNIIRGK